MSGSGGAFKDTADPPATGNQEGGRLGVVARTMRRLSSTRDKFNP
jgi:hypothetical protein